MVYMVAVFFLLAIASDPPQTVRAAHIHSLNTKPVQELLTYEHVAEQLVVRFKPVADSPAQSEQLAGQILQTNHCTMLAALPRAKRLQAFTQAAARGPLVLAQVQPGVSLAQAIQQLRNHGQVEYVEPNYRYYVTATPDDPFYIDQKLWHLEKTKAEQAWDAITDARSIIVAVIDTGADQDHLDLAANITTGGYDYYGNNDSDPEDDNGHGTHVAGIIGAVGNNGRGVTGVAWKAKLMLIRSCGGAQGTCNEFDLSEGIQHAIDQGAVIINASWGGSVFSQANFDLIDDARTAGILFVTAAGNSDLDLDKAGNSFYPCEYNLDNILCVGNTLQDDSKDGNYGVVAVDLGAPGTDIWSCTLLGNYATQSGSSMAAACVTGTAALIRALRPDLNYLSLKSTILGSVDIVNPPNGMGLGALNIGAALNNLPPPPMNIVYVDLSNPNSGDGSAQNPFKTIAQAIAAVVPGGQIIIYAGRYFENVTKLNTPMTFSAQNGKVTIGN